MCLATSAEMATAERSNQVPTIAVIGGGPGAMFFCHALETQRKELEAKGEDESSFPIVKCFERSAGPGGVWRSDRTHDDVVSSISASHDSTDRPRSPSSVLGSLISPVFEEKNEEEFLKDEIQKLAKQVQQSKSSTAGGTTTTTTPNMYSGLWTNGPKELYEMHDYNFRDHFGDIRMPTHLPRKYVLEYLLARVTRNCHDFFERYFQFRTTVVNVRYIGETDESTPSKKFRVCTLDETTGMETVEFFDKCLWAGGNNGVPKTPKHSLQVLERGGFKGKIVHSSDTSTFKEDVEGKNVLIVGGGLSAEDLALMAIKEGVSKIYSSYRSAYEADIASTTRWPYEKVVNCPETTIKKVDGSTIILCGVYKSVRENRYLDDLEVDPTVLKNIDTVIFCTGYKYNVGMLDEELQEPLPTSDRKLSIPKGWTMKENVFTQSILGDKNIKPKNGKVVKGSAFPHSEGLYKGSISIQNPNMMYMQEYGETPLGSVEVTSWMLAKIVTNQIPLPSVEEMEADTRRTVGECLQCGAIRYQMDCRYQEDIDEAIEKAMEDGKLSEEEEDELWEEAYYLGVQMICQLQGEIMNQYRYPVSYLCPDGKTKSKYCEIMTAANVIDGRFNLKDIKYNTDIEEDGWRTFRDNPLIENIESYFTGIRPKLLPKPWVDLEEDDKLW